MAAHKSVRFDNKQGNFLGQNKPGQVSTHINIYIYIYYSTSLCRVQITPKKSTNTGFILERGLAGFPQFGKTCRIKLIFYVALSL